MKELVERFKAPLNDFWKRAVKILLTVSGILTMLSEFVQPIINDDLVPEEYKPYLRMVYMFGYGGAFIALLTKKDSSEK